ncbi:MAG: hypothetical protein IJU29_01320 [Oscillospiraceae bacterium]|nr:hypothetical protein [Oscillospiraceae bacterium]
MKRAGLLLLTLALCLAFAVPTRAEAGSEEAPKTMEALVEEELNTWYLSLVDRFDTPWGVVLRMVTGGIPHAGIEELVLFTPAGEKKNLLGPVPPTDAWGRTAINHLRLSTNRRYLTFDSTFSSAAYEEERLLHEAGSYYFRSDLSTGETELLRFDPASETPCVCASPQSLTVDGVRREAEKYNIGGSNYFRLRDLAYLMRDTAARFDVSFDPETDTVSIRTGTAYADGPAEAREADFSETCVKSAQSVEIDGVPVALTAYNLGGSDFFRLRELGELLGFGVDFAPETDTAMIATVSQEF